jgi:hypothetical protein
MSQGEYKKCPSLGSRQGTLDGWGRRASGTIRSHACTARKRRRLPAHRRACPLSMMLSTLCTSPLPCHSPSPGTGAGAAAAPVPLPQPPAAAPAGRRQAPAPALPAAAVHRAAARAGCRQPGVRCPDDRSCCPWPQRPAADRRAAYPPAPLLGLPAPPAGGAAAAGRAAAVACGEAGPARPLPALAR